MLRSIIEEGSRAAFMKLNVTFSMGKSPPLDTEAVRTTSYDENGC